MPGLSEEELATYEWQLDVPGFGASGQEKLKNATVLISRVGGLGSVVAYELAAAGVGKLILAHAGNIQPSDLNRQLLMTHDALGTSRVESASRRLNELNPRLEIEAIAENISESNAESIINRVDVVVDCAPLFEERMAMNNAVVKLRKPLIECAMYELQAQITTILPGKTPCLSCLHPNKTTSWKRRFPVIGAVSGTVGCLGAMEAIKVISGLGDTLENRMLLMDLRDMSVDTMKIKRRLDCSCCASI